MTLLLGYDSEADQSAAKPEEEGLALVPLVSPGKEDDIPLAPLAAIEDKPSKPKEKKPPVEAKPEPKSKPVVARVERKPAPKPVTRPPRPEPDPRSKKTVVRSVPVIKEKPRVIAVKPAEQPPVVREEAPSPGLPVVSMGVKLGQISPRPHGGTSFTGSLDLRYILPVFDGRLTLGVEGGYYQYRAVFSDEDTKLELTVIPVSLQLFYRIPLGTFLEPFVGIGGDVFIWTGDRAHTEQDYTWDSGNGVVFGGHVAAGLEVEAGPGFIVVEARGGVSFGSFLGYEKGPNISGISSVAGYRLEF
jgi:hypothetical protein